MSDPNPQGGLRDRLLLDSVRHRVLAGLTALGWFEDVTLNTPVKHEPINWRTTPVPESDPVPPNTLIVLPSDNSYVDMETGSDLSEDTHDYWIDFYGQSTAISTHMMGDIRDILRGIYADAGYGDGNTLDVCDWDTDPTGATVLFNADIEQVEIIVSHNPSKDYERFWQAASFRVVEERE